MNRMHRSEADISCRERLDTAVRAIVPTLYSLNGSP